MELSNKCPICTFNNALTNTNCDVCDALLVEEENIIPETKELEDKFMALTGDTRTIAQEYLKVSDNLDKAVSFYFQDKELGTTNADYTTNIVSLDDALQLLSNNINTPNNINISNNINTPSNIYQLVSYILYTRLSPHHCKFCDSKAFLIAAKIISYKENTYDIIRLIQREHLESLNITPNDYNNTANRIFELVNNKFISLINKNLKKHIIGAYKGRQRLVDNNYSIDEIEEIMNDTYGMDFRLIWDTIYEFGNDSNIILESLNNLIKSEEFHSYLNQSWETPNFNHPASQEIISSLKKVKLSKDCKYLEELEKTNCSICMTQFEQDDDMEVTMLGCHSFCTECINVWLGNHNDTCPVCRKKVNDVLQQDNNLSEEPIDNNQYLQIINFISLLL